MKITLPIMRAVKLGTIMLPSSGWHRREYFMKWFNMGMDTSKCEFFAQKVHDNFFCNSAHLQIRKRGTNCVNMVRNLYLGGVVCVYSVFTFSQFSQLFFEPIIYDFLGSSCKIQYTYYKQKTASKKLKLEEEIALQMDRQQEGWTKCGELHHFLIEKCAKNL